MSVSCVNLLRTFESRLWTCASAPRNHMLIFKLGKSIGIRSNILSIVLLLPPAPAALVLLGRALATLSALSAAAFLLMAVAGPPGGLGDEGRAVVVPVDVEPDCSPGEVGRGDDCGRVSMFQLLCSMCTAELHGLLFLWQHRLALTVSSALCSMPPNIDLPAMHHGQLQSPSP